MRNTVFCALLTLCIITSNVIAFSEPISPTPTSQTETPQPQISDLPDSQVITLSPTERIFYKKGKVEKMEIDGILANPTMPLEFVACSDGGKDYESLVVMKCKPWNVHLSLILAGLKEGKGPQFFGDTTKPTGDLVVICLSWEKDNKIITHRIEELLINSETDKPLDLVGWSFSGSSFTDDIDYDSGKPTGKKIYMADIYKNIIATWHDPTAILNLSTKGGLFVPNKNLLPERGSKIVVTIRPPAPDELEQMKKAIADSNGNMKKETTDNETETSEEKNTDK